MSIEFVSIHTSAREVTCDGLPIYDLRDVSIHTSAREVTLRSKRFRKQSVCFNPHFRKGSDIFYFF